MSERVLFGLKNCDACRKAAQWLDQNGYAYRFHDLRVDGLDPKQLDLWLNKLGWEQVINRKSTTWRSLDEASKTHLDDVKAFKLLLDHPTLITRPILMDNQYVINGFNNDLYAREV